jgi:hypothetical protein
VVHGQALGRPDHQALLAVLVLVGLIAERELGRGAGCRWRAVGAWGWGLALWVSPYEPLVLFGLCQIGALIGRPSDFRERARWAYLLHVAAVAAVGHSIEGWRLDPPRGAAFWAWAATIGELRPTGWGTWVAWYGWALVPGVVLVMVEAWKRRAWAVAMAVVGAWVLTAWQARWGLYLGLTLAVAWGALPRWWEGRRGMRVLGAVAVWGIALWPVLAELERMAFPERATVAARIAERGALRGLAEQMGDGNFVSAWWDAPALAYASGQPGVAGSSHGSLPGIAASVRIFDAASAPEAEAEIKARDVRWIVVGPYSRWLEGNGRPAETGEMAMGRLLAERPSSAPPWLELVAGRDGFLLYRVVRGP